MFSIIGVTSSNAATFGVGAIQVVATAISTWLVDKAGRRLLLTVSISSLVSYLQNFSLEKNSINAQN